MEKHFLRDAVRRFLCIAILGIITLGLTQTVQAHARLVRSSPSSGNAVTSPDLIELWFNEMLDGQFNYIQVFPISQLNNAQHISYTLGEAVVDPKNRTHLSVKLQMLQPGEYYVEWRVLSLDGHSAPGRFRFQVTKPH